MILFLKYASVQKTNEPPKPAKEAEPPVKEVTKETRVIHETPARTDTSNLAPVHLGESLG